MIKKENKKQISYKRKVERKDESREEVFGGKIFHQEMCPSKILFYHSI